MASAVSSEAAVDPGEASAAIDDAANDLVDPNGAEVSGPAYMDALRLEANIFDESLQLLVALGGVAPTGVDGTVEQINYLVQIDTDAADDFDFWLSAENRSSGEYAFVLTNWAENYSYDSENNEFPGSAAVSDDLVIWRIPLDALGNPTSIRVSLWTQTSVDFEPTAEDYVPDAAANLSADAAAWLVVLP